MAKKWLLPILGIIGAVIVAVIFIGTGSEKPSSSSEKQSPETKSADNRNGKEEEEKAKIEVLSQNTLSGKEVYEWDDSLYVMGEVKNTGSSEIGSIIITAKFLDKSGVVVASGESGGVEAEVLKPGEVTPYRIRIENPPKYETYNVDASAQSGTSGLSLAVLSKSVRNDESGHLIVSGEVQNLNEKKVSSPSVTVWFLKGDKVVWAERTSLSGNLTELNKNQRGSFEANLVNKVNYDTYKVQSSGYSW